MTRADWNEIEAAYVAGEGSFTVLAERFHVSRRQLAVHARDDGWTPKREARAAQDSAPQPAQAPPGAEIRHDPEAGGAIGQDPAPDAPGQPEQPANGGPVDAGGSPAASPDGVVVHEPPDAPAAVDADPEPVIVLRASDPNAIPVLWLMATQLDAPNPEAHRAAGEMRDLSRRMKEWARRHPTGREAPGTR